MTQLSNVDKARTWNFMEHVIVGSLALEKAPKHTKGWEANVTKYVSWSFTKSIRCPSWVASSPTRSPHLRSAEQRSRYLVDMLRTCQSTKYRDKKPPGRL